jgi:hypothetical protein
MEHAVVIKGKPYTVTTHQRSKTVWVASGGYMGKDISIGARSEQAALGLWRGAARYRGNAESAKSMRRSLEDSSR